MPRKNSIHSSGWENGCGVCACRFDPYLFAPSSLVLRLTSSSFRTIQWVIWGFGIVCISGPIWVKIDRSDIMKMIWFVQNLQMKVRSYIMWSRLCSFHILCNKRRYAFEITFCRGSHHCWISVTQLLVTLIHVLTELDEIQLEMAHFIYELDEESAANGSISWWNLMKSLLRVESSGMRDLCSISCWH